MMDVHTPESAQPLDPDMESREEPPPGERGESVSDLDHPDRQDDIERDAGTSDVVRRLEEEIRELQHQERVILELPSKQQKNKRGQLRKTRVRLGFIGGELNRLKQSNYGRTIPDAIVRAVLDRDRGRNFGRPHHTCIEPGPPHHITHFADFKGAHTQANPHTVENLEAPCKDCHKLAHAMNIQSGTSIETFFTSIRPDVWPTIEELWKKQQTGALQKMISAVKK